MPYAEEESNPNSPSSQFGESDMVFIVFVRFEDLKQVGTSGNDTRCRVLRSLSFCFFT